MNESTADQSTSSASREFFCELCSLEFSTKNDFDEHCCTLLHHRKLDEKKGRNCSHQCTLCDQEFFGLLAFTTHIHGEKHEEAVQKWRKEQRWNEWSFSNESKLEDQSAVSESGTSRPQGVEKGGKNKRKKQNIGQRVGNSPRPQLRSSEGGLPWKDDGKQQFERQGGAWNEPNNGNQNRNRGFPAQNQDQNSSFRRRQEKSFENTNQGPRQRNGKDPLMDKPVNFGGQERTRVDSGEGFSDYYDDADVNYQDFEGKQGSESKWNHATAGDDGRAKPGNQADVYEQPPNGRCIEDSTYMHGSESESRNIEWRLESVLNSGGSGTRRSSKEGDQALEASRQTVSRENGNEYRPERYIAGRSFFGSNTRAKPNNKNSKQSGQSVTSGKLSNSRPKEQERRNSRKGKPHKLASNNSSRSSYATEGNESVLVLSSDSSSLNISGDTDSFRSETGSSVKKQKRMQRDKNRGERRRQKRQRKYEKEMEERMVRIQWDAISGVPSEGFSAQPTQNSSNRYSDYRKHEGITIATATEPTTDAINNITSLSLFSQESAQHLDMFTSEEKNISAKIVNPSHMTTSTPIFMNKVAEKDTNSAQRSEVETALSLSKHQREAMLRSALGIKKEPIEPKEEISNSSLCSAKIKEEPDTVRTSSNTADRNTLRVSSHMSAVVEGPPSLVSSIPNHSSIPMASVHVALTTPCISPPRPQCIFVRADGVRCDAVTWNKAYCNYHWWLSEQESKNRNALGSTNTVPFSRDGLGRPARVSVESKGFCVSSGSGITTPAVPTICLSSMTSSLLPGMSQPDPVRPNFRFATMTLSTAGKGDTSKVTDSHIAGKARTDDTAASESSHKSRINEEDWKTGRERKLSQAGEIDLNETSPKSLKVSQVSREIVLGNSLSKRFVATQLKPRRASTGVREEDRFDVNVPAVGKTLSILGESHARLSVFQRGRRSSWNAAVDSSLMMPPASGTVVSPGRLDLHVKQEESNEPVHASAVGMIDLNNSTGLIGRPHQLQPDVGKMPLGQRRYEIEGSTSSVIRFGTSPPRVLTPERKSSSSSSLGRSSVSPITVPYSCSGITQELRLAMSASRSLLSNTTTKHDFPSRTSPSNETQTPPRIEVPGSLRFPKSLGGSPTGTLANVALDLGMTNLPPAVRRALALRYGSKKGGGVGESVTSPVTVAPNVSKSRSRFVEGSKAQSRTQTHDLPQIENRAQQVQPSTDHSQVARIASSITAARAVRSRRSVSLDSRSTMQFEQVDFVPGRQNFHNISPKATSESRHGYTRESCNTSASTAGSKSTVPSAELALGSTSDANNSGVQGVGTGLSDLSQTVMQGKLPLMDLSSTSYLPASVSSTSKDSKDAYVNNTSGAAELAKHSTISRFLPATSLMSHIEIGSHPDNTSKSLKETWRDKTVKVSSYLVPVLATSVSGARTYHDSNYGSSTRNQLECLYRNVTSQNSSTLHNDRGNPANLSRSLTDAGHEGDTRQMSVSHSVSHATVDVCRDSLSRYFESGYEGVTKPDANALSTSCSVSDSYRDSISRSSTKSESDVSLHSGGHPTELMDLNTKPYVRVRQNVEQKLAGSSTAGLQGSPMRQKRPVGDDDETCVDTTELGPSKRIRDTERLHAENRTVSYAPGVNVDGLLKLESDEQEQLQALNSVQSRLKLVRSHIQKLCTELDSLHSEENRIAARMSQLRSARLQILQLAVCEQRSPVQGSEESRAGDKHVVTSHRSSLAEFEFHSQGNPYEGPSAAALHKEGASGIDGSSTRVSSPAPQKNNFSSKSRVSCPETIVPDLQGSSSGRTSEANSLQNIGDDFPPDTVFISPVKDSAKSHKTIEGTISKQGLAQPTSTSKFPYSCDKVTVKSEFGKTTTQSGLTGSSTNMNITRSVVVNCDSTPRKAFVSLAERVKKRRSMSLDDRHCSNIMAEVATKGSLEWGLSPRNNTFQQLTSRCPPDLNSKNVSSLNQEQKVRLESVSTEHRPSTQDQGFDTQETRRRSVAIETTEPHQLHSVENNLTEGGTADEQTERRIRKEQHRVDVLRKMNQLHFPGKFPLQTRKGRKRIFSDVKVSSTIAQSKQKLLSVKEKMKQWRQNTEDMTRETGANGSGSQSVVPEPRNCRNNPHVQIKRQKHCDRQRNDRAGDDNAATLVRRSPRSSTSSTGEFHRKSTKELKKSSLFNVGKKGTFKEKKRKRERQGNDRKNQSGQNRSTKGLETQKREEISKKSRKFSHEEQQKINSSTTTESTCPAEADNATEAGPSSVIDEIPTRDVPSSPSADTTTDNTGIPKHLRIPSSTVASFRKHILGKSIASKSQSTTFAAKFEGHTSAVCAIQVCEGHIYTCSADKTTRAFDIQTGECLKTYHGHHHAVNCLQISSDGQKLFTGSNDQTVRSYNIKSGVCSHKFTFDGRVMCLHAAFELLFVGLSTGVVACICLKSNTCVERLHCHEPRGISCLTTATEGQRKLLCTGSYDSTVTIRDHKSGLLLKTLTDHKMTVLCLQVVENVIYSGAADKKTQAHNLNTGELLRSYDGHEASVTGLQVVGRVVITSCLDKLVRCYDLVSAELLQVYGGQMDMIFCVHMANGRIYTGSRDGGVTSVKLDLRVYRPCKWKDCELNFGIVSHLQDHVRDYHVMQQGNLERCQWMRCNQQFSQGDDISVVLKHVLGHVDSRRARKSAS